ncbi:SemiSWEET family transporter [Gammaproteobacteria bacterium]|nr:SemiSWEET family transporter [Gammaproteobacteria bacterium]
MSIEAISGTAALITSLIGLIPQIYKSALTRSTRDISLIMLINYAICSIAWMIHAFFIHSNFVFYSNIFGLITVFILLTQKWIFDVSLSKS